MAIQFEFQVIRANLEGGESEITLYIKCDVTTSFEEEGHSFFVSLISATNWDGNEVDLTSREHNEVENIAVDIFTGDK